VSRNKTQIERIVTPGKHFALFVSLIMTPLLLLLAACGGGNSSSTPPTSPISNPVPSVTSVSPSVVAAGAPNTLVAVTGTNFLSSSSITLNGTALSTSFVSSTQLTATIPAASLVQAATDQVSVTNPSPGGGASSPQALAVIAIGSLVIMATPMNGGPGNGTWQLSVAVVDTKGNAVSGLIVSLSSTEGTLSQNQGTSDSTGTVSASISPPASYSSEAIVVSATAGSQTAAVNIAFTPSAFDPSNNIARQRLSAARRQRRLSTTPSGAAPSSSPFVIGASAAIGTLSPFLTPSNCYSNLGLSTLPTSDCQTSNNQNSVQQVLVNIGQTVCTVVDALGNAEGIASCAGTAAIVGACLASETGIGAIICDGTVEFLGDLGQQCVGFLVDEFANALTHTAIASDVIDILTFQPESAGASDVVGLVCEAADIIGSGTGSTGTTIGVTPSSATVPLGGTIDFSAAVTPNSDMSVTWAVNAVQGGSGPFGTIDNNGVYTAPAALPSFNHFSVTATSVADPTASASAVVQVTANLLGTIQTVAGNGIAGYSGDNGPATSATLSTPSGVAFDGPGNMFIADSSNNAIRRVAASTQVITTIAGTGVAGFSGDGGSGSAAQLNDPTHVVFDRTVNLYITDAENERIREVNSETYQITTIAGTGSAGFSGDGAAATTAQLNFPDGVAIDRDGDLYIGDALNNRVREIHISTSDIATVAGNGIGGYAGDGGPATDSELNFPSRPFVDAAENIYIADYQNHRIRKVDGATGIITTVAGTGVAGYSGDGGPATNAQLNGPLSVALDATGTLYIADTGNERIRAVNVRTSPTTVLGITIQPGEIETVVGTGAVGYSGDGGPATNAEINLPTGLIVDSSGNLFFADAHNNVVRKVTGQLQNSGRL
jgi:sugar lactone lactonase YvrE